MSPSINAIIFFLLVDRKHSKTAIKTAEFPSSPGVYLFKDERGKILYVGKAKNLRARLRSYFSPTTDERPLLPFLKRRVADVEYIVTKNEKEALFLENTLIKKHKPRYNIKLRDDKTYISLRLDLRSEYPRFSLRRKRRNEPDIIYIGPFSSVRAVKETLRFVHRIFPLRVCSDYAFRQRARPCLYYQVGKCLAPCVLPVSKDDYQQLVDGLLLFFRGKKQDVLKMLRQRMQEYSERMEFERAALVRDRITAIEKSLEEQKVASPREFDLDAIALGHKEDLIAFTVLCYREGLLNESRQFEFKTQNPSHPALFYSFITQYYGADKYIPPEILLSEKSEDQRLLEEWLTELRQGKVKILMPQKGEKRRIIDLAQQNVRTRLESYRRSEEEKQRILEQLKKDLNLTRLPRRIECFDISNVMGTLAVGSLVSFCNTEPDTSNYRRFKIRSVDFPNDYAMMREVLQRRLQRLKQEEAPLPDLLLIDGGKGQLNIALEVLKEFGIKNIDAVGVAKGKRLKMDRQKQPGWQEEDHLYLPRRKNPVFLGSHSPALHLLQRIRDEAHRFAITYHRLLRRRRTLRSVLDDLPGIGKKRRDTLLRHFGSLARIKQATLEELKAVPGIPATVAQTVHDFFHPPQGNKASK